MKKLFSLAVISFALSCQLNAAPFADRFVWLFGWNLADENSVPDITRLLENASKHGINGAVLSGFDTLCKKSPEELARLDQIQKACEKNNIELIPAVFSVGYGGGFLAHDRNLAEGLPVDNAPFVVNGSEARIKPDFAVKLVNGGFEDFTGEKFSGFSFYDQPGEIGFVDTQIKHSGKSSLRMEHFTANPHGHGRINKEVRVQPHRSYRLSLWVKTEDFQPKGSFKLMVLANDRDVAPREFDIPSTTEWRQVSMLFNSLDRDKVLLYAGVWGGKSGKVWLDDWSIEEVGPVNVLHRPGTPVKVQNQDCTVTYTEGKDYAPLSNPGFSPWRDTGEAASLKILPGSRIHDGDSLRVSWYHSMIVNDSQVTVCMGEPALYTIIDHEARLLAERFHPRRVMLNMDEVRMGGTCLACRDRNMGELLGECITRHAQVIRRYSPGAQVYVWSDMLDPNHNAKPNYYLVNGDYTGSWKHVPKDLVIAVWGGEPRPESLRFFADQGFETLAACYYDADDLKDVKAWLDLARKTPKARGLMYTPWLRKYSLLPEFGDLLMSPK